MTTPTPDDRADGAPFRTPSPDPDCPLGMSPESAAFFMSPEAAVRTYGVDLISALLADGFDAGATFELLAAHMSMPTGLPIVDGVGQPARIDVKGHASFDGLIRVVGRRTRDVDTLTPGGVIVEYLDHEAGRPAVRWLSEFALFSIAPTCEGALLDRLCDQVTRNIWRRHCPEPILLRSKASEDGAELDASVLLDRAAIEYAAAVKACPLPGAWGKGLAPAVILLHLRRLLESRKPSGQPATAKMPRWLPSALIEAAQAWHDAERGRAADDRDDDPIRF